MIQAVLKYPPSVNGMWRYGGKGKAYLTVQARTWKQEASWTLKECLLRGSTAVAGPFHFHMEVGRPDKRKRDIDNLLKPVLDALQMSGVIQDDHYAQSVFAQWVPELVGIRVTITPAE